MNCSHRSRQIVKKHRFAFTGLLALFQMICVGQVSPPLGELLLEDSVTLQPRDEWLILSPTKDTLWQIGSSRKLFAQENPYHPPVIVTDTVEGYPPGTDESFTVVIPESYYSSPWPEGTFSFYHRYQTDSMSDGGFIEISYDYGETWMNVVYDTNHILTDFHGLYTEDDTLSGGIPAFTGTSEDWVYTELHWVWLALVKSAGTDQQGRPMIRFRFLSDSIDSGKGGWAIDRMVFRGYDVTGYTDPAPGSLPSVFPNPANEWLQVRSKISETGLGTDMVIFRADGRIAHQSLITGNGTVDITALGQGFYLYVLKRGNRVIDSGKFVKMNE